MIRSRFTSAIALTVVALAAPPAGAQFFLKSPDFRGEKVQGDEPGIGQALPGATESERRAALIWNMRAALNVAALQCQFEPTLLSVTNYNAVINDHSLELKLAFDTVERYFMRVAKTPKAGQAAIDQFGTRTYAQFATVAAQYGFCQTAGAVGRDAIFVGQGHLVDIVLERTRELRNSLIPMGEQQFQRHLGWDQAPTPRLDPICWDKKGRWVARKCGVSVWPAPSANVIPVGRDRSTPIVPIVGTVVP
jgi:hypothetical protein